MTAARYGRQPLRVRCAATRGVVLIMVVAVLGILFVAGAALLSVVTFSSRSIDAARIERENREAVDALDRLAGAQLRDGFLNADGIPYAFETPLVVHRPGQPFAPCAPDSACVVALPTYGEQPGVHLWLDVNEPIEVLVTPPGVDPTCEYRFPSNLLLAAQRRLQRFPAEAANTDIPGDHAHAFTVVVNEPYVAGSVGGTSGAVPIVRDHLDKSPSWHTYNDADGDGVLDGIEMTLPPGILPANVHRSLSNRLRASAFPAGGADRLTLTLRIVDHGSMADLNTSHDYLRRMSLGYSAVAFGGEPTNADLFAGAPYLSESNEWFLRNRGMLLPLSVQPTRLLENAATTLLGPQALQTGLYSSGLDQQMLADPTARQWWRYSPTDVAGSDADDLVAWRTLMNPENAPDGTYNVTHNVTTVSHDDLLMRGWVHPVTGEEMLAWIQRKEQVGVAVGGGVPYAIDNYPLHLAGSRDVRLGRLKVSLPDLDTMLKTAGAGLPRVMETVRNAFTLMLTNRPDFDFNVNGNLTDDRAAIDRANAVQTAMLTANFLDFVDSEDPPVHTAVGVIDTNGIPVLGASGKQLIAYGFERQPYITEVYTKLTPDANLGAPLAAEGASLFAVELYNPYDQPLDIRDYRLVDLALEDKSTDDDLEIYKEDTTQLERVDADLPPVAIPPHSYLVICGYGLCPAGVEYRQLSDEFAIVADSTIALKRKVKDLEGNDIEIIVDQMACADDPAVMRRERNAPAVGEKPDIGDFDGSNASEVCVQRDTTPSFWRFTVPKATKLFGAGKATLAAANHGNAVDTTKPIYPVHVDTAYSSLMNGTFTFAFPTTGSMLLLSSMAHIYDATEIDKGAAPGEGSLRSPFNRVSAELLGSCKDSAGESRERNIVGQYDQIDNGRMPVFDVRPDIGPLRERRVTEPPVDGLVEGAQALPWGQFVFDYFTAVSLVSVAEPYKCDDTPPNARPIVRMQNCYGRRYPKVDQGGLRVHGRINLNTASWKVLAALPMIDNGLLPRAYQDELQRVKFTRPTLGEHLAKSIVAFREARDPWTMPDNVGYYGNNRSPYPGGSAPDPRYRPRRGYGFLGVGELFDVRDPTAAVFDATQPDRAFRFDADATVAPLDAVMQGSPYAAASFEHAIANIVGLDDNWVTTKSHVFTIYGVIRGAHWPLSDPAASNVTGEPTNEEKLKSFREADQKAIRFQSTVDRLPMFFGANQPERVGSRVMGALVDDRSE